MHLSLAKIHCFDFRPGLHILEAVDACGMEGEKCELDQCNEEGVKKSKAAVFVAKKTDGGCGKQSLLGARE